MPAKKKTEANPFDDFDAAETFGGNSVDLIDLTEVPDEIEYEVFPRGVYEGKVEDVEFLRSKSSNRPMLKWTISRYRTTT
jgi:hypothetical protein